MGLADALHELAASIRETRSSKKPRLQRTAETLAHVRSVMFTLLVLAFVVLLGVQAAKESSGYRVVLGPLNVSKPLVDLGFSSEFFTSGLYETIQAIVAENSTAPPLGSVGAPGAPRESIFKLNSAGLDAQLPDTGISMRTLTGIVRELTNQTDWMIDGFVVSEKDGTDLKIHCRVSSQGETPFTLRAHAADPTELVQRAAWAILDSFDWRSLIYYLAEAEPDEAIRRVDQRLADAASTKDPHDKSFLLLSRAYALSGVQRFPDAVVDYRAAMLIHPPTATTYAGLGYALEGTGDLEGAAASFRAALELEPGHKYATDGLVRLGRK